VGGVQQRRSGAAACGFIRQLFGSNGHGHNITDRLVWSQVGRAPCGVADWCASPD
jgi:hypothetical protein